MKNTGTYSFSTPISLMEQLDNMAEELHISRSALLTAILSVFIKWNNGKEWLKNATNWRS